jgi:hypothetical protein
MLTQTRTEATRTTIGLLIAQEAKENLFFVHSEVPSRPATGREG